jgi:glycosyltransferase involved in cell wall biosynthesis
MARRKCVLYVQYTNPGVYPPLDHSSHILAEAGWEVLFLGMAIHPTLTLTPHPRIQVRSLPYVSPGWRQKVHYLRYLLWALWWVLRWQPAWVYASDPMSAPVAWLCTFLPNVKVLYHEHDAPDSDTTNSAFMRFILGMRQRVGQRAMVNVIPNEKRATLFAEETATPRPVLTVWNCPARHEVPPPVIKNTSAIRLIYHGSIVPQRLPLSVIDAMVAVQAEVELHVVGYDTQTPVGYSHQLKEYATQKGIGERVILHGALATRADLLHQAAQCHIGLAFMPPTSVNLNLDTMAGASNKPFDYMACGLAILVTPLPEWEALYVQTGYGVACDPTDPAALAQAIQWYADHPADREAIGAAGRQQILNEWNYEAQFAPVLVYFEGALPAYTPVPPLPTPTDALL